MLTEKTVSKAAAEAQELIRAGGFETAECRGHLLDPVTPSISVKFGELKHAIVIRGWSREELFPDMAREIRDVFIEWLGAKTAAKHKPE